MKLQDAVLSRHACKAFDNTKKISDEDFSQIKTALRYSASSTNAQPWHFILASSDAGKQRIAKGAINNYAVNLAKISDASHVILFCAKTSIDDAYLLKLLEQEEQDGRYTITPEFKQKNHATRTFFVDLHRKELNDAASWMEKQVYLNIGSALLSAAVLGIDAVPIEGVDIDALNQEFDLEGKGLTAVAVIALGYHSDADFNHGLPKSRLPEQEVFTEL